MQLYTGSRLPYILPSSDTRKPGGRGVQLHLLTYTFRWRLLRLTVSCTPPHFSAMCNHSKHRELRHLAANNFGVLSALYTKEQNEYQILTVYECVEK